MARDDVFAKRTQTVIQVAGAQRLRWELSELTTCDGHTARGAFMATVRALPEENELRMLEEALLGTKSAVTSGDVIDYFATAILAAARAMLEEGFPPDTISSAPSWKITRPANTLRTMATTSSASNGRRSA